MKIKPKHEKKTNKPQAESKEYKIFKRHFAQIIQNVQRTEAQEREEAKRES